MVDDLSSLSKQTLIMRGCWNQTLGEVKQLLVTALAERDKMRSALEEIQNCDSGNTQRYRDIANAVLAAVRQTDRRR